ncbi:MAG: hypothetical protein WAL78_01470 [Candidatus Acidiferrales bacterium]
MKVSWRAVSGVVLSAVIALVVIAPGLQAGPAAQDKFTLPFDAQWGKTSLPAGVYTLSVDRLTSNGTIHVARGTQSVGIMLPQLFDYTQNQSKNPELVCIRHNGVVTVRALRLPSVGTFYFPLPKDLKVFMAQQPQMIETVSLEATGE